MARVTMTSFFMACISLSMAQQLPVDVDLNRWRFVGTPAPRDSPVLSSNSDTTDRPLVARRDDYTYKAGIGGYKVHTRAVKWNEARLACQQEGGHLAVINSQAEADAVTEIFENSVTVVGSYNLNYISIGFHDSY